MIVGALCAAGGAVFYLISGFVGSRRSTRGLAEVQERFGSLEQALAEFRVSSLSNRQSIEDTQRLIPQILEILEPLRRMEEFKKVDPSAATEMKKALEGIATSLKTSWEQSQNGTRSVEKAISDLNQIEASLKKQNLDFALAPQRVAEFMLELSREKEIQGSIRKESSNLTILVSVTLALVEAELRLIRLQLNSS